MLRLLVILASALPGLAHACHIGGGTVGHGTSIAVGCAVSMVAEASDWSATVVTIGAIGVGVVGVYAVIKLVGWVNSTVRGGGGGGKRK